MMAARNLVRRNPFTRPGFIIAAILVGGLVVAGVVVAVTTPATPDPSSPASTAGESSPVSADEGRADGDCPAGPVELTGTVDRAPESEWAYAGTMQFPVSEVSGPHVTDPDGLLRCFSHTPEGAVFAAASMGVQVADPKVRVAFADRMVLHPEVQQHLHENAEAAEPAATDIRAATLGFRLLEYDGTTAKVDIGSSVSGRGVTGYLAFTYALRWVDGDWKLDWQPSVIGQNSAILPNLSGYTFWNP